jgi:hypothetical protein
VLDVLEMALKACERLPGFASNEDDWSSYTEYVMTASPSLRTKVLLHQDWWPELLNYARDAEAKARAGLPSSG